MVASSSKTKSTLCGTIHSAYSIAKQFNLQQQEDMCLEGENRKIFFGDKVEMNYRLGSRVLDLFLVFFFLYKTKGYYPPV